jgi:hypothetical protein
MTPRPAPRPKQEEVPILRKVLARVVKADDLEVHTCKAMLDGVTVLDIRDYIPSTGLYGRGTTLPWNTETIKVLKAAMIEAARDA